MMFFFLVPRQDIAINGSYYLPRKYFHWQSLHKIINNSGINNVQTGCSMKCDKLCKNDSDTSDVLRVR